MTFPSGTVTFLFTDIESSTRLWEESPQAMTDALARHDAILREAVENQQGFIVKTTGDGIHAVFDAALDAVQAVLAAQRALLSYPWPENAPIRVRMALHSGEAEWREGDYYGSEVNRAARLMSLAAGSQILLSATTAALTGDQLPTKVTIRDLGSYRLRDLSHPEHIFQLLHPDLPVEFPPLLSHGETPNNLPQQLTSFIGRKKEIEDVKRLLAPDFPGSQPNAVMERPRLITLIGPGGTGKTRLSLRAGDALLESFPDGVWLVELAPLTDPQLIVQTVAAPLGLSEQPGRPLLDRLADYLRPRKLLLLLDNCEHLIDDCAKLADRLLRACPDLRILASSREALGIAGEQAYRVRSLALPLALDGMSIAELSTYEAVQLFVQRAAAVRTGFALTSDNAASVLKICRRLDGIPLAIELAAARARVLTMQQIATRLDNRFQLLTGGSRTALPRQRTLQALIDWSFDLLSEHESTLFHRLSVFAGGWTLEAAESVAGIEPLGSFDVLDLLEQLLSKSLVAAETTGLGMRYRFLETIRQYAQEKLAESGEANEMRSRHLHYFVDQSLQATKALSELRGGDWVERLSADSDNLRSAGAWALDHDLHAALQLCTCFSPRWHQVMPIAEVMRYLAAALAQVESNPEYTAVDAPAENRRLLGAVLASAGGAAFRLGLNAQAIEYDRRSISIAREVSDLGTLGWVQGMTAVVTSIMGDTDSARRAQAESDGLAGESSPLAQAMFLVSGIILTIRSEGEDAWQRWEKGMAMFRQGNEFWGMGMGHQIAAFARLAEGDDDGARNHAEHSLACYNQIGDQHFANIPRSILADFARRDGELEQAASMYRETMLSWRDKGNAGAVARCLECLAFIAHAQAEIEQLPGPLFENAAVLLGAAAAIRQAHNSPMTAVEQPEYETVLAALHSAAGETLFQTAWQRGQLLDLDQAVTFALSDQATPLDPV